MKLRLYLGSRERASGNGCVYFKFSLTSLLSGLRFVSVLTEVRLCAILIFNSLFLRRLNLKKKKK